MALSVARDEADRASERFVCHIDIGGQSAAKPGKAPGHPPPFDQRGRVLMGPHYGRVDH